MSRFARSLGPLAAVGAIVLLAACAEMSSAHVASNPPPRAPGPDAVWYHVSFTTDSYAIDADGRTVINQLIVSMQNNPGEFATIIGKTDTVGTQDYNMHLSRRRADAVRDALIGGGNIPPNHLETRWTGEHRQDMATAGGVPESANRVVDIAIDTHPN
jgi:outer membrane protein OmpA-like peptidoglycan-associated protein